MRAHRLGIDSGGNHYYYFSQFCGEDVRIYRQAPLPALKVRVPDLSQYEEPAKKSVSGVFMFLGTGRVVNECIYIEFSSLQKL